jgi:hypothetical protein
MDTRDSCTTVGPTIEDITELCDFCIEFTNFLQDSSLQSRLEKLVPGRGLESCQLCGILSSVPPTTLAGSRTSLIYGGYPAHYMSGERRERVCEIGIKGTIFRIWADIGKRLRSC